MSDSLSLSSRSDVGSFNEDYDNKLKPLLLYESNDPIRSAYFLSEWQLNNEVQYNQIPNFIFIHKFLKIWAYICKY